VSKPYYLHDNIKHSQLLLRVKCSHFTRNREYN